MRWVHRASGETLVDVVRAQPVPAAPAAWVAGEGHA